MTSAANHEAYGDPRWSGPNPNQGHWGNPYWAAGIPGWVPPFIPKPVLIVLTILGFMFWWPIGLAVLAFMLWSKRNGCAGYRRHGAGRDGGGPWTHWKRWAGGDAAPPSSGNRAFDDYRAETLRRMEEEQKDFGAFLDRLRFAKDKAEFDQFMAERRQRPEPPAEPAQS